MISGGAREDDDRTVAELYRPDPRLRGPDELDPPPVIPWASPDLETYVLGLLDRLDEVE